LQQDIAVPRAWEKSRQIGGEWGGKGAKHSASEAFPSPPTAVLSCTVEARVPYLYGGRMFVAKPSIHNAPEHASSRMTSSNSAGLTQKADTGPPSFGQFTATSYRTITIWPVRLHATKPQPPLHENHMIAPPGPPFLHCSNCNFVGQDYASCLVVGSNSGAKRPARGCRLPGQLLCEYSTEDVFNQPVLGISPSAPWDYCRQARRICPFLGQNKNA